MELSRKVMRTISCALAGSVAALVAATGLRADELKPSAIFSGLPPEVERRALLFGGVQPIPCVLFQVRLRLAPKAPRLTTSGLGDSQVALVGAGGCPKRKSSAWASEVALADTSEPQAMALRLSDEVVRDGGETAKGRIQAFATSGDLGGVDLPVARLPWHTIWPSFQWWV
jgi:hypothetical protein